MIAERLNGDQEAMALLFEWSMVEYLEQYLQDERMHLAYMGQGIIGLSLAYQNAIALIPDEVVAGLPYLSPKVRVGYMNRTGGVEDDDPRALNIG